MLNWVEWRSKKGDIARLNISSCEEHAVVGDLFCYRLILAVPTIARFGDLFLAPPEKSVRDCKVQAARGQSNIGN